MLIIFLVESKLCIPVRFFVPTPSDAPINFLLNKISGFEFGYGL